MYTHQKLNIPAVCILPELHICPIGGNRLYPTLCQYIFQLFPHLELILPSGVSLHQDIVLLQGWLCEEGGGDGGGERRGRGVCVDMGKDGRGD